MGDKLFSFDLCIFQAPSLQETSQPEKVQGFRGRAWR